MTQVEEYQISVDVGGGITLKDCAGEGYVLIRPSVMREVKEAFEDAIFESLRKSRAYAIRAQIAELELELLGLEDFVLKT